MYQSALDWYKNERKKPFTASVVAWSKYVLENKPDTYMIWTVYRLPIHFVASRGRWEIVAKKVINMCRIFLGSFFGIIAN